MKRRKPLQRRTPLRPVSKKRQQQRDALAPYRVWLSGCHERCDVCLTAPATDIHEIAAGSHRDRSLQRPRTWLYVCRACHDEIQGKPYGEQLLVLIAAIRRDLNWCVGRNVV